MCVFFNHDKSGNLHVVAQISHGQGLLMSYPLWPESYDMNLNLQATLSHMKWTGHLALRPPLGTANLTAQKINFSWTYKKSKK